VCAGVSIGARRRARVPTTAPSFNQIVSNPQQSARPGATKLLLHGAMAVEIPISSFQRRESSGGFTIGVQIGYGGATGATGRKLQDSEVAGAPEEDLSGPYLRLRFGGFRTR
jgi:hypothetical protein